MTEKMTTLYLFRFKSNDQGTQGVIVTDTVFSCRTLELPWRNNQRNISCIPDGEYETIPINSRKFGNVYWLKNVKGRSGVLIHSGNFAGDIDKGYKTHVQGCILLGSKHGYLENQLAVLNSRTTVRRFMEHMNKKPFNLKIMSGLEEE